MNGHWLLPGLLVTISACSGIDQAQRHTASEAAHQPRTFVYQCPGDYSFVARLDRGDKLWLFLPERTIALTPVGSASGMKFSDGGSHLFWSRGEDALLKTGTTTHRGCRNNPARAIWEQAKLSGVDFRAVGNEPGWHLEIREQVSILLVSDYGQTNLLFHEPSRRDDSGTPPSSIYHASANGRELEVILNPGPCQDSMADEQYPVRVEVRIEGKIFNGCGSPLH